MAPVESGGLGGDKTVNNPGSCGPGYYGVTNSTARNNPEEFVLTLCQALFPEHYPI